MNQFSKEEELKNFEYKCICNWSKDNKYGFIQNVRCSVHGKKAQQLLSECASVDNIEEIKK